MGKYNGAVVTTAGQNVIAQAITGTELTWTVMRTSSVAIPQGTDLTTLTSLSGIEQTSKITDASVYGNNVIQLSSRFSNTGITTVYYIQTVGIYGQLAGGAETLIAVMTAVTPDEMPVYDPDSPSAFIFNTQITVQNADAVTMTVNDTGTATVADLNRKVNINGGDISDTVVNTVTASTADYPVPAAGDSVNVIIGKVIKAFGDIKNDFNRNITSDAQLDALLGTCFFSSNSYISAYFSGADYNGIQIDGGSQRTQIAIAARNLMYRIDDDGTGHTGAWSSWVDIPYDTAAQLSALSSTKLNIANVVNNLTTTASGYALDARQGKALNDTKLNVANVVNNLTTTDSGYALDARQGKALSDLLNTMNIASVTRYATTLTTGATGNIVLGGIINDGLTAVVAPYVNGSDVCLRSWVSSAQNAWVLTAIAPNTGETVNNTSLQVRYWVIKFKQA